MHVERLVRKEPPAKGARTGVSAYTLLIDGEPVGSIQTQMGFNNFISWSGLDIGRDRSSPVSHYEAPFEFTGQLLRVTVDMHPDQKLDGEGVGAAEMARQQAAQWLLCGACHRGAQAQRSGGSQLTEPITSLPA